MVGTDQFMVGTDRQNAGDSWDYTATGAEMRGCGS